MELREIVFVIPLKLPHKYGITTVIYCLSQCGKTSKTTHHGHAIVLFFACSREESRRVRAFATFYSMIQILQSPSISNCLVIELCVSNHSKWNYCSLQKYGVVVLVENIRIKSVGLGGQCISLKILCYHSILANIHLISIFVCIYWLSLSKKSTPAVSQKPRIKPVIGIIFMFV